VVNNETWKMKDSGLLGSSFIQIPYLLKYFTMGIEYHHIHHINAKIPGYNLQKYHEEVVSKSSVFDNIVKLNMSDCYNNVWLALYDEDKKRFITFENKNLFNQALYYTNILFYVIFQIPVLFIGILLYPLYGKNIIHKLHNISLFVLDTMFLQIKLINNYISNNQVILLCNHTSSSDSYLRYYVNCNFICVIKDSIFYIPFLGQVFWLLDFIFVKRNDKNSRNNTKRKIIKYLNENNTVQLFPQGTREKNKYFKNNEIVLKKGSIEIALKTNVPVVLCYHNIGDRIDDKNNVIHFHKKVYAVCSNPIILPNEYIELPLEERVKILYKIIYDEFIRLEKIILDMTETKDKSV
jgi:1-acyl-sn-glycerol-3-phosphate acyltransferase